MTYNTPDDYAQIEGKAEAESEAFDDFYTQTLIDIRQHPSEFLAWAEGLGVVENYVEMKWRDKWKI